MRSISSDSLAHYERLGDVMLDAFRHYTDRCAMVDEHEAVSYGQLEQRIAHVTTVLARQGVGSGDVIAQLAGNSISMFSVMAAAYILGARSVTLHPMAGLSDHLAVIEACSPACVVTESYYAERAGQLRARTASCIPWFSHDIGTSFPCLYEGDSYDVENLRVYGAPETIIRLAFTGGTSGRSKGVMLSNRAMLTNTRLWLAGLHWPDAVRTLCMAPISHGAGSFIYPTLVKGGTVYLRRKFTPDAWFDMVENHQIQHTFIVPTMLYGVLDHPRIHTANLSSLSALVYGAAPMASHRIVQAMQRFGHALVQTYGQTEAPNTILILDGKAHHSDIPDIVHSAGRPFPGLEVALLSDQGEPVPQGNVGEICVKGDLLMSGYLDNPELTQQTITDGWLKTGDLARQDQYGNYFIVDRKKDMIITGGFNVYPREIEDVLVMHPQVEQAAVVGMPDEKWGEAVKAVIVPKKKTNVDKQSLIDYVKEHKGSVYAPKIIEFVDQLPLTGLGKIDKKSLVSTF